MRDLSYTNNLGLTKVIDKFGTEQLLQHLNVNWDMIDNVLGSVSTANVNMAKYKPDATGVDLSTDAFTNAINEANSLTKDSSQPVSILLSPGTYRIKKNADMVVPSLKCIVGYATIIVEDPYAFVVKSNFSMSHIKVVSKNTYAKTDGTLKPVFKATGDTDNVTLDNVIFDSVLPVTDGSVRASACFSLKKVTNFKMRDVTVIGYRQGIATDGLSDGIQGMNLKFYNVELPLYMRGSSPAVTDENYAKNIQFVSVTHVNTKAQYVNYFKQAGADTFLMEKCDTITIADVIAEYPVERTAYLSCCRNATVGVWELKNALGIKFVGGSNSALGVETIARECHVSHVNAVFDDATMTQQGYIAEFYWAKDWTVKNCTINGNGIASTIVSTMHYIENGLVEDCYGDDLKRGLFEYSYVGNIDNPDPTPDILSGNYTAGVKGLIIRKNTVKNSNTLDYDVVKLSDASPPSAGTYRYQDVVIEDNKVLNPVDDSGVVLSTNYCKGLVNINSVNGLRIVNNTVVGHKRLDASGNKIVVPFQVGSNSKNVTILHEEASRSHDLKYAFGTLYVSDDTKIIINTANKQFSFQDIATITVKHDSGNPKTTKDLSANFRIHGKTSISDSTDFALPIVGAGVAGYTVPAIFGTVDVVTDAGDTGGYVVTKAGAVNLKAGSATIFVTSVNTAQFAFLKDASLPRYLMRYKAGANMSFIVTYTINAV
jgi:hypothetical protein